MAEQLSEFKRFVNKYIAVHGCGYKIALGACVAHARAHDAHARTHSGGASELDLSFTLLVVCLLPAFTGTYNHKYPKIGSTRKRKPAIQAALDTYLETSTFALKSALPTRAHAFKGFAVALPVGWKQHTLPTSLAGSRLGWTNSSSMYVRDFGALGALGICVYCPALNGDFVKLLKSITVGSAVVNFLHRVTEDLPSSWQSTTFGPVEPGLVLVLGHMALET